MELSIFNQGGVMFLLRWVHLLAGVTWIGLLWYFNLVQGEYFKEADAGARSDAVRKLVPRALWWFRWGAMFTFLSGATLIYMKHLSGLGIMLGATMGTFMFLNVWLIIWPKQKIVIASAKQVAAGGEADPKAGAAAAKAGLASRTNTLFSIPMLFFMASSVHLPAIQTTLAAASKVSLVTTFGIVVVLQLNGMFGKTGPFTSVKGVIGSGLLLTVVLYLLATMS